MNRKFAVAALIALVVSLLAWTSAFANYTAVTGQLQDGKTGTNWTHGGTIYVYSCADMSTPLGTVTLLEGSTGAFTVSPLSNPGVDRYLCIRVTFPAVDPYPASNDYWKVVPDAGTNSGTVDAGVFYTNTGPTAVTVRDLTATTATTPWTLILAALVVLAGMVAGGLVWRRHQARA